LSPKVQRNNFLLLSSPLTTLLKKSVDLADQIFSASWKRFPN